MLKIFDVGHGQCIFLRTPNGRNLLIDCAHHTITGWAPSDFLKLIGVRYIDALVVSNFDEDHVRGINNLLQSGIIINKIWPNWRVSPDEITKLKDDIGPGIKTTLLLLKKGFHGTCGEYSAPWLECELFRTWALSASDYFPNKVDTNALSVVTEIRINGVSIMIGGDMPESGWKILLQNFEFREAIKRTDLFIASHHGRQDGCCDELCLSGLNPDVVIMSDQRKGFGTQDTGQFYRQRSRGLRFGDGEIRHVLSTDRHGTVSVNFDSYARYTLRIEKGFHAIPVAYQFKPRDS